MTTQHGENTSLTALILGGIAIGVVVTFFVKGTPHPNKPTTAETQKKTAPQVLVEPQRAPAATDLVGTKAEATAELPVPDDPLGIVEWAQGIERSIDAIDLQRQVDRLEDDILPAIDKYELELSNEADSLDPLDWAERMQVIQRVRERFLQKFKLAQQALARTNRR